MWFAWERPHCSARRAPGSEGAARDGVAPVACRATVCGVRCRPWARLDLAWLPEDAGSEADHTRSPLLGGAILFGGVSSLTPTHSPASSTSLRSTSKGINRSIARVARENVDRRILLGMVAIVAGSAALWQGRPA